MYILAAALQGGVGWGNVQWGTVLVLLVMLAGFAMLLIRSKLSRPPSPFATMEDLGKDKAEILAKLLHMEAGFKELKEEVRDQGQEFRSKCATVKDVDGVGGRVDEVEKELAMTRGEANAARSQAERTAVEVGHINKELGRLEAAVAGLAAEVRPISGAIGEVKGQLDLLIRHLSANNSGNGPREGGGK